MTLNARQQASILQLSQAIFNATPGAIYLEALGSQLSSGKSLAELAQSLVGNALFLGKNYSPDFTSTEFANILIGDLVGDHASAANKNLATGHIVSRMASGATQSELIAELSSLLSAFPASDSNWGEAALHYNTGNATKIVENLVGSTATVEDKTSVVDYIIEQMATGQTFGTMIAWAINALDGIDQADPVWGNAAVLFDNRIQVSHYYSVDKAGAATNLATLQQILVGVTTDAASVANAKVAIDDLLKNSSINLADLNGINGFRLDGVSPNDNTGASVSDAGDVNGDGFGDVIIGAPGADQNGDTSGASYVVFGKDAGFSAALALSSLDGSSGFRLDGLAANDQFGFSGSGAGDVNGDGFDDLVIGSFNTNPNGSHSGASYVLFGKASGFGDTLALSSLDGNSGFRLDDVIAPFNGSTSLVGSAGDVNGDGFDDLIVGAPNTGLNGTSYVVFGKASGFNATLDLTSLNGSTGFRLVGAAKGDMSGSSVSSAGDVNGDGFDDLIVGAPTIGIDSAHPNGNFSGASYVVFGKASAFSAEVALSSLDGNNGFRLDGVAGSLSGVSVSGAGDVNGDGFDDLIVGAPWVGPNGNASGASYVVFGKASGFSATLALSSLDGNSGFRLDGVAENDGSGGYSVSSAGDFNGDGFDDLIIGAWRAEASYVVFGKASGFGATLALSSLDGSNGFRLNGVAAESRSGSSVSSAGDVNNDGFDDLIIGAPAPFATDSIFNSGAAYIVFGHSVASTAAVLKTTGSDYPDNDVSGNNHTDTQDAAALLVGVNVLTDYF